VPLLALNFEPQVGQNFVPKGDWRPQVGLLHTSTRLARQLGQKTAASSLTALPHLGHLFLRPFMTERTPESTPPITALWARHLRLFLTPETKSSTIPIFVRIIISIQMPFYLYKYYIIFSADIARFKFAIIRTGVLVRD
jgi:hypothetical protein